MDQVIVGCTLGFNFAFMAYLLCAEGPFPHHRRRALDEVHVAGNSAASGSDGNNLPSRFPLLKVWWMVDIIYYSSRMAGWVQELRHHLAPHP